MRQTNDTASQILWVHRKPRKLGNFSIETSFKSVKLAWKELLSNPPDETTVQYYSSGIIDRIRIWLEVRATEHPIIHISGDIYYSVIGLKKKSVILTIHDLGMIEGKTAISRWLRSAIWLNLPLRSTKHVIAVSNRTKNEILTRTHFPAERITVIPSVVSTIYKNRQTTPKNSKPRILHIGLADNKNLNRHAAALKGLNVHLRIIGKPSNIQIKMLQNLNIDFSCASNLSEVQLQSEYAASDMLLFCSTLEGFGMPIIEAQIIGVPVITSALAPMDDTAGEGAFLVNPKDIVSIQKAVKEIIGNERLKTELISKGQMNAKRFSAANAARMHSELYAQIIEESTTT